MNTYYSIGQAAEILGVSISTLRRWEKQGRLVPEKMPSGHRRYSASQLNENGCLKVRALQKTQSDRITIAYARVSSSDQKADLTRQKQALEMYCASKGWSYEILSDLGSGMNYHKRGLRELLARILQGDVARLVITHKDRLLRFGAELVFAVCEQMHTEVVILNQGNEVQFEEELAKDVLEIITVFSARLYGSRSRKNQKLIESLKQAALPEDPKE